jgi:bacterioferritin
MTHVVVASRKEDVNQTMTNENAGDQRDVSATIAIDSPIFTILNGLLSGLWRACIQHQTHVAVIEAQGLQGLADAMRARTADEPLAIRALTERLVGLGGTPAFTIGALAIGTTVREVLYNDMALQRHTRPKFNAAAEAAAAAHDATTRSLIEKILADEEQHLSWLETEIALHEKLGESLYSVSRVSAGTLRVTSHPVASHNSEGVLSDANR